jgi:hypothetical protein
LTLKPKLGVISHTGNPELRRLRQEDREFQGSLVYIEDPVSKKKEKKIPKPGNA